MRDSLITKRDDDSPVVITRRYMCVAVHEDSLYKPPTMHLAFHMGTTYNRLARPGEQGQMGRNHAVHMHI
jgi:hypothetical protein